MIVKLAMFIKIIFSGIFALLSVISVNAMDAEFAGYTHQKAQVMGTKYKKELAAEKLKPIAAAPVSFAGTDTELLIRGITDGNNNAYVADVKPKIIALVDTWVENLRVGNADIVTGARGVRKKNTFRAAIQAAINTKAVVTASAVDADIITLKATKEAIKTENKPNNNHLPLYNYPFMYNSNNTYNYIFHNQKSASHVNSFAIDFNNFFRRVSDDIYEYSSSIDEINEKLKIIKEYSINFLQNLLKKEISKS